MGAPASDVGHASPQWREACEATTSAKRKAGRGSGREDRSGHRARRRRRSRAVRHADRATRGTADRRPARRRRSPPRAGTARTKAGARTCRRRCGTPPGAHARSHARSRPPAPWETGTRARAATRSGGAGSIGAGGRPWRTSILRRASFHRGATGRPGRARAVRRHCSKTRTSPVECTTLPPTIVITERSRFSESSGTVK